MGARRALLESESADFVDPALVSFQQTPRRGLIEDTENDALFSVSAYSARRAVASPISFEPDEPLTVTRQLPKITDAPVKQVATSSLKLRRGLLSAAAAVTAGAVLIVPNAMSTVTASPSQASAVDRAGAVSRSSERPTLVDPITQAEAEERIAEAEAAAEAARVAAEQKAAEEAAEAERKAAEEAEAAAEAERKAAEEAAAASQAPTEAAPAAPGEAPAPAAAPAPAPAPAAAPIAGGYCPHGDGSSLGLTYQAQAAYQAICAQFPHVSSYGGWRASADDHGAGQAIDIMISGPAGWEIANWLVANAGALGVEYVIYEQQIWGNWGGGFSYMEDRGSITQNHYDHVHVTIR